MRGQAFVTFRELEMAERAIREVRGFTLFGKPMVIIMLCTRLTK